MSSRLVAALAGRYWLVVAAYVAFVAVGSVTLAYAVAGGATLTGLTISSTLFVAVLVIASLPVAPAMVMDARRLRKQGRPRPRWWRHVALTTAVPLVVFLVGIPVMTPAVAAAAAGVLLAITAFFGGSLYLYERYQAVGIGGQQARAEQSV